MRTIKFRAWDKRLKAMIKVTHDYQLHVRDIYWEIIDLKIGCKVLDNWRDNENGNVLMQYTGIKDKNGKEIYEGDICRCIHSEQNGKNPFEKIEQVYTRPGGFSLFGKPMQDFSYESNNRLTAFNWKTDRSINIPEFYYKIYDIEVIGNIWEHPTLLAEKVGENEAK